MEERLFVVSVCNLCDGGTPVCVICLKEERLCDFCEVGTPVLSSM